KSQHHTYRGKKDGQLKREGDKSRQSEVRFTTIVLRPVCGKNPRHKPKCCGGSYQAINKTDDVKTRSFEPHGLIQSVHGKRCVNIVQLIATVAHLIHSGEEHFLIVETTYCEFFYCHF